MMKSNDKQISLTDPDARSMATSGKDTGIVGYADVEMEADAIEPEIEIAPDEDESEITPDEVTPEEADEIKIEAEEIEPASLSDSSEPVRVCVHCQLQPPDGLERTSSYAGAWLHPRCEAAFISARMAEEGLKSAVSNVGASSRKTATGNRRNTRSFISSLA
jgi:hypothetical protein